eukprot:jgi/Mesvir1/9727/Mv25323-RA.1
MDFFNKAKQFAQQTAETARLAAQEAQATARAKLKEFQNELGGTGSKPAATPPSEEVLTSYGVTPELRQFVSSINIYTFRDFPKDDPEKESSWEMSKWREEHARLVLESVQEVADFRYVLCPRRMTETRFWRVYFQLVETMVNKYEAEFEKREEERRVREAEEAARKQKEAAEKAAKEEAERKAAEEDARRAREIFDRLAAAASERKNSARVAAARALDVGGGGKDAALAGDGDENLEKYLLDALAGDGDDDAGDADGEDEEFNGEDKGGQGEDKGEELADIGGVEEAAEDTLLSVAAPASNGASSDSEDYSGARISVPADRAARPQPTDALDSPALDLAEELEAAVGGVEGRFEGGAEEPQEAEAGAAVEAAGAPESELEQALERELDAETEGKGDASEAVAVGEEKPEVAAEAVATLETPETPVEVGAATSSAAVAEEPVPAVADASAGASVVEAADVDSSGSSEMVIVPAEEVSPSESAEGGKEEVVVVGGEADAAEEEVEPSGADAEVEVDKAEQTKGGGGVGGRSGKKKKKGKK